MLQSLGVENGVMQSGAVATLQLATGHLLGCVGNRWGCNGVGAYVGKVGKTSSALEGL